MDPFKILTHGVKFDGKKFRREVNRFKPNTNEDKNINCKETIAASPKKKKRKIDADEIRKEHNILLDGSDGNCPILSFEELKVEPFLKENLRKSHYEKPTPIQMQAIPLMLDERDIIACAPTGSGKTLAFLLPLINRLAAPKKVGFRAIILVPTRELAKQIHRECIWLSEGSGLRVHLIRNTGLASKKFSHASSLKYDILVTTPQRLEFLLKQEPPAINIEYLEWLIIDECDRLFEPTFRSQLSLIFNVCNQSKAKLNHALFSATYDMNLENWCKLHLDNLVTVLVGGKNTVTETVEQKLLFTGSETGKLFALKSHISSGCQTPLIIFVNKIKKASFLQRELLSMGIMVECIHADRSQEQRDKIVRAFREGTIPFLICTELMGRGIDFKAVNQVINYDCPSSKFAYIHHIGRTGRAGRKGSAITYYTQKDDENLCAILNILRQSGAEIPDHLKNFNKKKALQFKNMEKKFALIKKRKLKQTSAHDTKEDEVEEEEEEEM